MTKETFHLSKYSIFLRLCVTLAIMQKAQILKYIFVFLILAVTFFLPVALQQYLSEQSGDSSNKVKPIVTYAPTLRIVSLPPKVVVPGQTFEYRVEFQAKENNFTEFVVGSKPAWLSWDPSKKLFFGKVPNDGSSVFQIEILARDTVSGEEDIQRFEVFIVEEQKQDKSSITPTSTPDVKGVKTASTQLDPNIDPFHPKGIKVENPEQEVLGINTAPDTAISPIGVLILGCVVLLSGTMLFIAKSLKSRNTIVTKNGTQIIRE